MFFKQKKAFTLIELAITICIVAIIATLAIPSFYKWRAKQEMDFTLQKIMSSLYLARSESIAYRSTIIICSSLDHINCKVDQWDHGFIIFIDSNNNQQLDPDERLLKIETLDLKYAHLSWKGFGHTPFINFTAKTGLPIDSNGTFTYCSHATSDHKAIILNKMGNPRIKTITNC